MQEGKIDVNDLRIILMVLYLRGLAFKTSVVGLIDVVQQ